MSNPTGDTQSFEDVARESLRTAADFGISVGHGEFDIAQTDKLTAAIDTLLAAHTAALRAELEALLAIRVGDDGDDRPSDGYIVDRLEDRIAALTNPQEGR